MRKNKNIRRSWNRFLGGMNLVTGVATGAVNHHRGLGNGKILLQERPPHEG